MTFSRPSQDSHFGLIRFISEQPILSSVQLLEIISSFSRLKWKWFMNIKSFLWGRTWLFNLVSSRLTFWTDPVRFVLHLSSSEEFHEFISSLFRIVAHTSKLNTFRFFRLLRKVVGARAQNHHVEYEESKSLSKHSTFMVFYLVCIIDIILQ